MDRHEVIEGLELFTKDAGMWKYHYCVASLFSDAVELLKEDKKCIDEIYNRKQSVIGKGMHELTEYEQGKADGLQIAYDIVSSLNRGESE